jgi:mRNA interferase MazF
VHSRTFKSQAHRQSLAVGNSVHAQEDQNFIDEAPLFRILIEPNERNGLHAPSKLMVDKITTVPKDKLGSLIGRLGDEDMIRLNQAILVFLGLARSPRSIR